MRHSRTESFRTRSLLTDLPACRCRSDIEERKLCSDVTELKDENERLQGEIKQLLNKERHLNAQLQQVRIVVAAGARR